MAYDPDDDDYDDDDDPGSPANKKAKSTPIFSLSSAVKPKSNKILVSPKDPMSDAGGEKKLPKPNISSHDANDDTYAKEVGRSRGKEEDEEADEEEDAEEGLDMDLAKSAMNADKMV